MLAAFLYSYRQKGTYCELNLLAKKQTLLLITGVQDAIQEVSTNQGLGGDLWVPIM